ncbi:unnamed protein product [Bemisia tabaci]|uniref:PH domain-containing protein n=1 Tax=Bemisia tabaci TaxID=7038 RepID=A0A9P0AH77_BEMTA|nr:PREDICTED: oxysterol-binding protein-related protein 11 [Bemisia tabaci]CAH0391721.1 unnamed protein product [Bemisia tabaci]
MLNRKKRRSKKKAYNSSQFYDSQIDSTDSSFKMSDPNDMCQAFEGQLYKYTNVMKGYQYRWFILDPKKGVLNYYLNESETKQQPRGSINLLAAVISPSDEDSHTFTVNSINGESFKLKASDARARQEWVNKLRAAVELHAVAIAQKNPPLTTRDPFIGYRSQSSGVLSGSSSSPCSVAIADAFNSVREHLSQVEFSNESLIKAIEELPANGSSLKHVDTDLLLLKAASQAMCSSLNECTMILQQSIYPFPNSQYPTLSRNTMSSISQRKR